MKTPEGLTDRLIKFLDKQADDDVFSSRELEEKLKHALSGGAFLRARYRWKDYETKVVIKGRPTSMWGNKTAIRTLRQQQEKTDEN